MSFRQKLIVFLVACIIIVISVGVAEAVASSYTTCLDNSKGSVLVRNVSCRTAGHVVIAVGEHLKRATSLRAFNVRSGGRTWRCTRVTIKHNFGSFGCASYVNGRIAAIGVAVYLGNASGTQS